MITTKLVIAGISTALVIGGAGVVVVNSLFGEDDSFDSSGISFAGDPKNIKEKLLEAKFDLLSQTSYQSQTNEEKEEWKKLLQVINSKVDFVEGEIEGEVIKIQRRCQELFKKMTIDSYYSGNNYLEALKKCTKIVKAKERAQSKLSLVPLKTATTGSDTDQTALEAKLTKYRVYLSNFTSWTLLADWCKQFEDKNHWHAGFNEDNWNRYVTGCMQEEKPDSSNYINEQTLSYWTRDPRLDGFSKRIPNPESFVS